MERKADIEATVMFTTPEGSLRVVTLRIHDGATVADVLTTVQTLHRVDAVQGITLTQAGA